MFRFEFINMDETFGKTGEVNSPRLKEKKRIDPKTKKHILFDKDHQQNGLFSEVVFGPTKDYQCACGRYKGVQCAGKICERCGVTVQPVSARRFTYGHIVVGKDLILVNPEAFKLLLTHCVVDKNLRTIANQIVIGKLAVKITTDVEKNTKIVEYVSPTESGYTGPMAFKEIIYPQIKDQIDQIEDEKTRTILYPMIDHALFTSIIPVVPPDLRPVTSGSGSTCFIDELNKIYLMMLVYVKFIGESPVIPHDKLAGLQQQFFTLSDLLLKKLSSKSGLMRKYILGKRVDYSGRSVVVPDPSLNLQEIDVSFYIVKEIFQPAILPKLADRLHISELEAMNKYESAEYDSTIFDICKDYEGYPMILNRQPTLHRPSILVFYIRHVIKDYVIAVPPTMTPAMNMDFDGDQAAIYAPIGGAAYAEAIKMTPLCNMTLPSNGELAFGFEEDLVLGLYKLSLTKEGREKIYEALPEDVSVVMKKYAEKNLTGQNLNLFFSELIDTIDESRLESIVNILSHLSFNESVISISLTDFKNAAPGDSTNPVSLMVDAQARGKWSQVKQIQQSRGFVSDVEGRIIPSAINSSLLHGLSNAEYFASAYGSIKGLIDTSRNTSLSGYLTRRLVYITSGLELSDDVDDCGTDHYLPRMLDDKNYNLYLYRFFKDPETNEEFVLTKFNYEQYLGRMLLMRSPLFCQCEGNQICHKCYGLLYRKHKSRQIGFIAAQSIGERASQLTLRTKHISGATNITLPSWAKIENGLVITEIPTVITITPDSVIISDQAEQDEFEIPYATINIIAPNSVKENSDEIVVDEDDENIVVVESKYSVSDTGKIATISIKSHDVVTAVAEFSRYLRNLPDETSEDPAIPTVLDHILNEFGFSGIHSIHYELMLTNFCRNANDQRLYYRHFQNEPFVWMKEKNLLDNSLIQSMVFERFNQKLSKLLIADNSEVNFKGSILSKLTSFDFDNTQIADHLSETWLPNIKEMN